MDPTLRDIADFYRFALDNSHSTCHLVELTDVVAWVDSLITTSDIPEEWMFDLSLAKTPDIAIFALSRVPPPATDYLGASIFVANLNRLWSSGALSRDDACHLLWNLRDHLRPEYDVSAIAPEVTLEDADACFTQEIRDPGPFTRVDEALVELFGCYEAFDLLIPAVSGAHSG